MRQDNRLTYSAMARNSASSAENKVHEAATASRLGYAGALVSGSIIYSQMTYLALRKWGSDWLEHGHASIKFLQPVYDGDVTVTTASMDADHMDLDLKTRGRTCATGHAGIAGPAIAVPMGELASQRVPLLEASPIALKPGLRFGLQSVAFDQALRKQWLDEVGEQDPPVDWNTWIHPGLFLRLCNQTLAKNIALGPWIHASSHVQHHAKGRVDEPVSVSAEILRTFENKGHRCVELDMSVYTSTRQVLARVTHLAIYQPHFPADEPSGGLS